MTRALLAEILEMMEGRSPMDSKAIAAAIKNELAKPEQQERNSMTLEEIRELFIAKYPKEAAEIEMGEIEGIFARSAYRKFVNDLRAVEAFHGIGVPAP